MATKLTAPPISTPNKSIQHKLWRCGDPLDYVETMPKNEGNPLDQMYKRMQGYDKELCDTWRDEIEHLLIFAGLFSATVTAFLVDSYKWLQRDYSKASTLLLQQISVQLAGIANNATSTMSTESLLLPDFVPEPRGVRANILWFMSLIMCLSAVVFGILCLQWLNEFRRDMSFSPADAITIRQMRFDGLTQWKVPVLISWLPIILQTSVLLFFAGILDLLWSINHLVAIIITTLVGMVALMIVFTTLAPVIQTLLDFHHFRNVGGYDPGAYIKPCPYRSPISWITLRFHTLFDFVLFRQWKERSSWADFDIFFHERSMKPVPGKKTHNTSGLARALKWMMSKLSPELNQEMPRDVFHSLHSSLDSSTSNEVLLHWAEITGVAHKVKFALEYSRLPGMRQAQRDLLLEQLLRKCSPVHENRALLLELQVRCLNTFGDREEMREVFCEAANHCYYYCSENIGSRHLKDDGLVFQALMALLKNYNHLHNRTSDLFSDDFVGSVLATVIRHTPVDEHNASICYEILNQFRLLLEEIYQEAGDCSNPSPHLNLYSTVQLLHKLDLGIVEKWQSDIQRFNKTEVPVIEGLVSFTEKLIIVLEKGSQKHQADEMNSQLNAFRQRRPYSYMYMVS